MNTINRIRDFQNNFNYYPILKTGIASIALTVFSMQIVKKVCVRSFKWGNIFLEKKSIRFFVGTIYFVAFARFFGPVIREVDFLTFCSLSKKKDFFSEEVVGESQMCHLDSSLDVKSAIDAEVSFPINRETIFFLQIRNGINGYENPCLPCLVVKIENCGFIDLADNLSDPGGKLQAFLRRALCYGSFSSHYRDPIICLNYEIDLLRDAEVSFPIDKEPIFFLQIRNDYDEYKQIGLITRVEADLNLSRFLDLSEQENTKKLSLDPSCIKAFAKKEPFSKEIVGNNVEKGLEIFDEIYSKKQVDCDNDAPAYLMWYLMYLAYEQKRNFQEGTFNLSDPGGKLYAVLRKSFCYRRLSSHYTGRIIDSNYGIDVLRDAKVPLPTGKQTILFAQIRNGVNGYKEPRLFIKMENYGSNCNVFDDNFWSYANIEQLAGHSYEFVCSQLNKWFPTYVSPIGVDQTMQKEHLLEEHKGFYIKALSYLNVSKRDFLTHLTQKKRLAANF